MQNNATSLLKSIQEKKKRMNETHTIGNTLVISDRMSL